jgi:hypothetical protein
VAHGVRGVRNLSQNANEPVVPHDEQKEIKVKIPVEYHVKLHTLKVLKGQEISTTVESALTRYFDILADNPEGKRLEKLSDMTVENLL